MKPILFTLLLTTCTKQVPTDCATIDFVTNNQPVEFKASQVKVETNKEVLVITASKNDTTFTMTITQNNFIPGKCVLPVSFNGMQGIVEAEVFCLNPLTIGFKGSVENIKERKSLTGSIRNLVIK